MKTTNKNSNDNSSLIIGILAFMVILALFSNCRLGFRHIAFRDDCVRPDFRQPVYPVYHYEYRGCWRR